VGIGELFVIDAFPAGIANAGPAQPAPTGPFAPIDSGRLRTAPPWVGPGGGRLFYSVAGRPYGFRRVRTKHFERGFTIADYFIVFHLILIVKLGAGTLQPTIIVRKGSACWQRHRLIAESSIPWSSVRLPATDMRTSTQERILCNHVSA
jgi:hypothetical protein